MSGLGDMAKLIRAVNALILRGPLPSQRAPPKRPRITRCPAAAGCLRAPAAGGVPRLKGKGTMRGMLFTLVAILAIVSCDSLTQYALADGTAVARKKVRAAYGGPTCGYYPCRPVVGCPDRYSCWSLYGAYGPYGGAAYWSRYSYEGWWIR